MDAIKAEANIASNLIVLCIERGLPAPFAQSDIDEILSNEALSEPDRRNQIRRIKAALHEVVYSPPSRGV